MNELDEALGATKITEVDARQFLKFLHEELGHVSAAQYQTEVLNIGRSQAVGYRFDGRNWIPI